MGDNAAIPTILESATVRFGDLSVAEKMLLETTANACEADCDGLSAQDRLIRGEVFSWMCTSGETGTKPTQRGVYIAHAVLTGKVDLSWAQLGFPIVAVDCVFRDPIILTYTRASYLRLSKSSIGQLTANRAVFDDCIVLD